MRIKPHTVKAEQPVTKPKSNVLDKLKKIEPEAADWMSQELETKVRTYNKELAKAKKCQSEAEAEIEFRDAAEFRKKAAKRDDAKIDALIHAKLALDAFSEAATIARKILLDQEKQAMEVHGENKDKAIKQFREIGIGAGTAQNVMRAETPTVMIESEEKVNKLNALRSFWNTTALLYEKYRVEIDRERKRIMGQG